MKRPAVRRGLASVAVTVFAVLNVSTAVADRFHSAPRKEARHDTAPKDCTRYNGRWGYYGNPWCTPAEQRAFDLWEARRLSRQRLRR
ncbi:MAG: hypothetical protein AB7U75_04330 [Hyphomicrobiaceae bacterium]